MRFVQALILPLLLAGGMARADWGVVAGIGGFQGDVQLGAVWDHKATHNIALSVGRFEVDNGHGYQFNLGYLYSPVTLDWSPVTWSPVQIGLVILYAADQDDYFVKTPSRFPYEGYYEQTGLRGALRLGSQVGFVDNKIRLSYELAWLDTGIIADYNNHDTYQKYFLSAGVRFEAYF